MTPIAYLVATLIASGLGAYFGSYLKKKGENLATREDVERLTAQVEEVKATISDRVWNRQRQWEMKRDALYAAVDALARAHNALVELAAGYVTLRKTEADGASREIVSDWMKKVATLTNDWRSLMANYDGRRQVASLVCSMEMVGALNRVSTELRSDFQKLANGTATYDDCIPSLHREMTAAYLLARSEIGVIDERRQTMPVGTK